MKDWCLLSEEGTGIAWDSAGGLRQARASGMGPLCCMDTNMLAHPGNISLKHPLGTLPASSSLGLYVHVGVLLGFHVFV